MLVTLILSLLSLGDFDGGYGGAAISGGYTQSPGGFGSPTATQGEKKQVCSVLLPTPDKRLGCERM